MTNAENGHASGSEPRNLNYEGPSVISNSRWESGLEWSWIEITELPRFSRRNDFLTLSDQDWKTLEVLWKVKININNPSFPLLCNSLKNKLGCKVIDEKNHFPVIFATQTHINDDLLGTQSPSFFALFLGSSAPAMAPATGSATQPGLSLVTDVPAQQLQIFCQKLKLLYFEWSPSWHTILT